MIVGAWGERQEEQMRLYFLHLKIISKSTGQEELVLDHR